MEKFDEVKALSSAQKADSSSKTSGTSTPSPSPRPNNSLPLQVANWFQLSVDACVETVANVLYKFIQLQHLFSD